MAFPWGAESAWSNTGARGRVWRALRWPVLASGFVLALGCSRFKLVRECQEVQNTINSQLDVIETMSKEPVPPADKLFRIAKRYRVLGRELRASPPSHGPLAEHVKQYAGLVDRIAVATLRLSQAYGAKQAAGRQAAQRELDQLAERQTTLSRGIERLCVEP